MRSVLLTAAAILLLCQQPAKSDDDKALTPSQKLSQTLAIQSLWEFPGNPLDDVLKLVEGMHKIEIDYRLVNKAGVSLDVEINAVNKGLVSEMLTEVLVPVDIEYLAKDGKIVLRPIDKKRREAQLKDASPELRKTLSHVATPIEFPDNPVGDVVEDLVRVTSVKIFFDKQSLESAEKSEATRVKAIYFGPLVTILDEILHPAGMAWKARGDQIVIQAD